MSNYICVRDHVKSNHRGHLIPVSIGEEISQLSYLQLGEKERSNYEIIPCPQLTIKTEDDLTGLFEKKWNEDKNIH